MNALVPERAMVPSASTISSWLMPMPLSSTVRTARLGVDPDGDAGLGVVAEKLGLGDGLVAQPLAGIGGVGDQLAEEHVLVGIDRVHHEVQQARNVGFERPAFRLGFGGSGHGRQVSGNDSTRA